MTELQVDVEEMRKAMGVDDMEARLNSLETAFNSLLAYTYQLEQQIEALEGEPIVKGELRGSMSPNGQLSVRRIAKLGSVERPNPIGGKTPLVNIVR